MSPAYNSEYFLALPRALSIGYFSAVKDCLMWWLHSGYMAFLKSF